jgi:hypothetical protein
MIRFIAEQATVDAAAPDGAERRTITAVAAPYGKFAQVSDGQEVAFAPGSLPSDGPAPKVFLFHDSTKPVGIVTERVEMGDAMMAQLKISKTQLGDETLALAADGVYQVSVGVTPLEFTHDADGRMIVTKSRWDEISLVPHAAFAEDANITKVAASAEIHEIDPDSVHNEDNDSTEEQPMEVVNPAAETVEAATPTAPISFAQPKRAVTLPTPGEWLAAAAAGGSTLAAMSARIQAAAPDVIVSDLDGVMPTPTISSIFNSFRGLRPVIDALGPRGLPQGGKVFIRPVVTTNTSIAEQVNQNTAVQAGTFVVSDLQFDKKTFGGYVELSEQSIDWSSPEVLGALIDDMARVYANQTDNYCADTVAAGATQTLNFDSTKYDDPAYWAEWIYWAAATILTNSNGNLPSAIMVDPNMWQRLGRLSDTADRPLFPQVGPMNAFGQMQPGSTESLAFGMRVVVDRNFPVNTLIVADPRFAEYYEQIKGSVSLDNPSQLSRTIAFRGYAAAKVIEAKLAVKATIV